MVPGSTESFRKNEDVRLMKKKWRIAGISFDHMHMGDQLRQVYEHPETEIAGVWDNNPENREALENALRSFAIPRENVFSDLDACLDNTRPDIAILCSATRRHADLAERLLSAGIHVLVEKPFAASLADADRMAKAARDADRQLLINWPLAWYPPHLTAKRIIDEGRIGEVLEVHFYDGNRGPTHHLADKIEVNEEEAIARMQTTWWYRKDAGGGSLLDYLGYGATLGTWYHNGTAPSEITATTWSRPGLEVDEHSVTVARYDAGLSTFGTRWGTFTDPWTHQPQPRCGFVLVGTNGTISNYDYAETVRMQTREKPEGEDLPVDTPPVGKRGPIEHFIDVLNQGTPVHGPLSLPICRVGQQIVDTAYRSAEEKRTLRLIGL